MNYETVRSRSKVEQYLFDRIQCVIDRNGVYSLESSFIIEHYTVVEEAVRVGSDFSKCAWSVMQDILDRALFMPQYVEKMHKVVPLDDEEAKLYIERFLLEEGIDALRGVGKYKDIVSSKYIFEKYKGALRSEIRIALGIYWSARMRYMRVATYECKPIITNKKVARHWHPIAQSIRMDY